MALSKGILFSLFSFLVAMSLCAMDKQSAQTNSHGHKGLLGPEQIKMVDALNLCVSACNQCIASCADHQGQTHPSCTLTCMDCVAVSSSLGQLIARGSPLVPQMMAISHSACQACVDLCGQHTNDEACINCAQACQNCLLVCSQADQGNGHDHDHGDDEG